MAHLLDSVPFSGIIRIRDMMYGVENPFRLDQGDVSFDAPDTFKDAMRRAIADNQTHYAQTTGLPRLRQLLTAKLRRANGVPVEDEDDILVTNGGIHGLYVVCQALLEPGDEVIVPDPEWPPCMGNVRAARGVPVPCPLHERLGWRYDLDELAGLVTPKTRALYLNSPHNPTGGVLEPGDVEAIAALARERGLWLVSDEAYEDIVFDGARHVSPASLAGMYDRTISVFTFSKTYAVTGLRLGYVAARDAALRERMRKALFYTTTNVSTVVQHGGIGALEGSQDVIAGFRRELQARRDFFYDEVARLDPPVFEGTRPAGAFYAFLRVNPEAFEQAAGVAGRRAPDAESLSWSVARHLIERARVGCVPGVDFGANGEGYVRFCFARDRQELAGALDAVRRAFTPA